MTAPPSTDPTISVDDLAAKLPEAERLAIARWLVIAAFKLVPKDGDCLAPAALELASFMNGAVTALLHTAAERRQAQLWDMLASSMMRPLHTVCIRLLPAWGKVEPFRN